MSFSHLQVGRREGCCVYVKRRLVSHLCSSASPSTSHTRRASVLRVLLRMFFPSEHALLVGSLLEPVDEIKQGCLR